MASIGDDVPLCQVFVIRALGRKPSLSNEIKTNVYFDSCAKGTPHIASAMGESTPHQHR